MELKVLKLNLRWDKVTIPSQVKTMCDLYRFLDNKYGWFGFGWLRFKEV